MPPARRTSGDIRSARVQMKTADQTARVGKDNRAKVVKDGLVATLVIKAKEDGTEEVSQDFRLAENVGIMPLMEWAAASDRDVQSADGLKAVYYVLQDAVDANEWAEFRKFSREHKAEAAELLDFANAALEALAGRPTKDAAGSSDGS